MYVLTFPIHYQLLQCWYVWESWRAGRNPCAWKNGCSVGCDPRVSDVRSVNISERVTDSNIALDIPWNSYSKRLHYTTCSISVPALQVPHTIKQFEHFLLHSFSFITRQQLVLIHSSRVSLRSLPWQLYEVKVDKREIYTFWHLPDIMRWTIPAITLTNSVTT